MSITGGIKFFETSKCLNVNGATASASSGDAAANYALDRNPYTLWYTNGSNDLTTETFTITLTAAASFNRIFLLSHNFKQYTLKYKLAGVWTDFTNVRGMDGLKATISETTFSDTSSYYEFDLVSATEIQMTVTKTQTANQEKELAQIVLTKEIGTLAGFPVIKEVVVDRNSKVKRTLSGRYSIQKADETANFSINFKGYPSAVAYNVDIDLMMTLHDLDDPFLVWLCGGKRGTTYFNYTLRGFRLQDLYQMQIEKAYKLSYTSSITKNSLNCEVLLQESI
jgi:hypothetical protein